MRSIRLKLAGAAALLLVAGFAAFVAATGSLLEPYYVARTVREMEAAVRTLSVPGGDPAALAGEAKRLGAETGFRIDVADGAGLVVMSSSPEFREGDASPLPRDQLERFLLNIGAMDRGDSPAGLVEPTGDGPSVVQLTARVDVIAAGGGAGRPPDRRLATPAGAPGSPGPGTVPGRPSAGPPGGPVAADTADGRRYLVLTQPMDRLRHTLRVASGFSVLVAAVLFVVEAIVAFVAAGSLVRPIIELTGIARRMAALDFAGRWGKARDDEIGSLGASVDHMADELSGTIRELSAANRRVLDEMDRQRELLAAVSHEFKTPAGLMRGYAEAIKLGLYKSDEERTELADVIIRESDHLDRLVRDLAAITSTGARPLSISTGLVDLSELAGRGVSRFRAAARGAKARLLLEEAPGLDAAVVADGDRVVQVLDNFLSNAVRHVRASGRVVVRVLADAGTVSLEVENEGDGVPEDALPRLFEPFFRTDASRSRDGGGSGLGLAVVKAIMTAHGGDCAVRNTADGVLFRAAFPRSGPGKASADGPAG